MNFLNNLRNDSLIICNNYSKKKILEYFDKNNIFINIKIMSLEEFYNHYYYTYDEKTIYYLKNKYNLSIKNAKILLNNIKYTIDKNINNKKINYLKDIYNDLNNNNLLIKDNYFKEYIKNKKIYIIDKYIIDNFLKKILKDLDVEVIDIYNNKYNIDKIYKFLSIEEECEYVFNKISYLIKNNIDLNDIKICILGNEYNSFFKRFSFFYHIPLYNLNKNSIISTIECNTFLNLLKNNFKDELLENIKDFSYKKQYLNILNKYYFIDNYNDVYEDIKEQLKNTYIEDNISGIEIVSLDDLIWYKDKYIFILGFNLENVPHIYKDIDYFNDKLKEELGLNTSFDNNKISYNKTNKILNSLSNITLSYKEKDPYKSYYKSNIIEELNLKEETIILEDNTSNLYNKIKLTNYLDKLLKYNTYNNDIDKLYNTYKDISYLTYSNKYNIIDNINNNINLSYTSINSYYHCAFKYYIDYVLKLNIFEESFSLYIGTIYHFVLSKIFDKDFDFNNIWNIALEKYSFNKKEEIYLKELKEELKKIIDVILYQHKLSGLNNLKLENEIVLPYENNKFIGIIDKIMFKEKDNNTYITIVDYKTGNVLINMKNLKYGLDMQLPIYVYLVKKSNMFFNPKIIGFYLEQILFDKFNYDSKKEESIIRRDKLKLNGYSINDPYLVSMFDETYQNSELIKGMKITSKGFSAYSKILSENDIDSIVNTVEKKIEEAFAKIKNNDFSINPKVINGENIGCRYCKYKDLCFKTGEDLVYLKD